MIYLHTLGDTLIKVGEKEIRPTAPLLFAALLYLGMERGRRVSRAALQELLFPEADERSGAHSLRQLLYKLRQLGAPIDTDTSGVVIQIEHVRDDSSADLSVSNGHDNGFEKSALRFLPDYEPKLSDRYAEWLEHKRSSVTANVRRQLVAALGASREAINWQEVERFAHLILEIDPFNEEATLAFAEATALSGAKAKALAILSRYEHETGRADLRLPPSVLRKRISEAVREVNTRAVRTPFVGREAEAEALRRQILLARSGKPSFVVIAGEAGIGKTRLLEEACALAALEGVRVLTVRCQSHYSARPLSVFIELVPLLLPCRGALGVSPQSMAHLNLLISHADDRDDRPTDARDDSSRSGALLFALRDLVDAVAAESPLLLAIEDAHWADIDSLRELISMAGLSNRSLTVICTARALETIRMATAIDDRATIRRLRALSEQPMAELAKHLLPRSMNGDCGDVSAWCVKTAAGNPLFLQMLCAHYNETGQPFSVPPSLVTAITRRIEQLPQTSRRILEFCALLGPHSTVDALRSLGECTRLQLLNSAQQLEDDGYLAIRGEVIRISHDLLSECTLQLVSPVARRVLHSCVASTLEDRYDATHDASILWDCAEQWNLSGETTKALQFLKRCARHASQMGRAAQALSLLERAKQLAKYSSQVADLLGEMMFAAKASGQWSDTYDYAKELASMPHESVTHEIHSPVELLAIEALWAMRQEGDVKKLLGCVSSPNSSTGHRFDAALLLLRMAHELCDDRLAAKAYLAVKDLLDERSANYSTRILPLVYHATFGDRDQALTIARNLRNELDDLGSIADQIRAVFNIATALCVLGESDESCDLAKDYYDRTGRLGMKARQRDFCSQLCSAYLVVEDFEQAAIWHERMEGTGNADSLSARKDSGSGVELAIWKGDTKEANERLKILVGASVGIRGKSYLRGIQIRVQQMDPDFLCDDNTISELVALHETTKRFISGDTLVLALAEALRRRGRLAEVRVILDEYLHTSRRERGPILPSFAALLHARSDATATSP